MGDATIKAVIIDAGPLIHLHEIDALHLLYAYEAIHIPDAVWFELTRPGRVDERDLLTFPNLRRHLVGEVERTKFVQTHNLNHLQRGEQECLYLCHQSGINLLLTDDLAARKAAQRLGVYPAGSLGVIARAYWQGKIGQEEAAGLMRKLHRTSSLFVTEEIVDIAIERLMKNRIE